MSDYEKMRNEPIAPIRLDVALNSGGSTSLAWNPGTDTPIVLGLYGSLFATADTTATNDLFRFDLLSDTNAVTIHALSKRIAAGQHVRVDYRIPGGGWVGAAGTDVFLRATGGFSGGMTFSGFLLVRIG